jgi:hypothetical protein
MAASAWADSRKTAEELKDGAIRLRGLLLDEKIPAGTMDPVLAQCKALYLGLDDISIAPAAKDLDAEDLENLITMKNAVLAFHKELWKLMTISDQLTRTPGTLDQVLLREQRADIVHKLLGAISTYLRLLPVFSELAGRDWPASPEVNDETPGKATA